MTNEPQRTSARRLFLRKPFPQTGKGPLKRNTTRSKVQGSPICEGEDELSHLVHSQSMTAKQISTKPYKAQGPPVCGKEDKEANQFNQTVKP